MIQKVTEVCLLTGFSSKNSRSVGKEFHHAGCVVPLWIFPALQFYTSPLIGRDTCSPHALGTQFVGSQQFRWTWPGSKQSYRRVLHNEVMSSHRPAVLLAAAQSTGTKNKWHNSCTSLQNDSDLAASPLLCVQQHSRELVKMLESSSENTETLGCKYLTRSPDHFAPGSILRTTHKERVLKSATRRV